MRLLLALLLTSAIANADPLPANIHLDDNGGDNYAVIETGAFDTSPLITSVEQEITITGTPNLTLDFSYETIADPTGTGGDFALDGLVIGIDDGFSTYELLLADHLGNTTDPFGGAPGPVSLITPTDSFFDYALSADLSAFTGQTITLFFDLSSVDDGLQSIFRFDNVLLSPPDEVTNGTFTNGFNGWTPSTYPEGTPVPEASTVVLLGIGLIGIIAMKREG